MLGDVLSAVRDRVATTSAKLCTVGSGVLGQPAARHHIYSCTL